MATQKVRPDQDRDERQRAQRRQVSRTLTFGTLAIAAIVGAIAVLFAVVAVRPEVRSSQPSATGPAVVAEPSGSPPAGSERPAPQHEMLPMNAAGYVVYVRTAHRSLRLTDMPFRLGDRFLGLLASAEPTGEGWTLTTEDARALAKILEGRRFELTSTDGTFLGKIAYAGTVDDGIDINRHPVDLRIEFRAKDSEPAAPDDGKHGKLVMGDSGDAGANHPSYAVYVFADGRVIWRQQSGGPAVSTSWLVRRLTEKGLDSLQPDATPDIGRSELRDPQLHRDPLGVSAGVWKDPTSTPYRASRYAVCPSRSFGWGQLPPRARSLLRSRAAGHIHGCLVVPAEDADRLDRIFLINGFEWDSSGHAYPGDEYRLGAEYVDVIPVLPNATFDVVDPACLIC